MNKGPRNSYRVRENVVYAPWVSLRLAMDIFRPEEPLYEVAILFVHGGGWDKGDKDAMRAETEYFASQGWVTAAVNYRLSQDAIFPAPYEDICNAIRYLRQDYPRVAVLGHSAGGHLAALAGLWRKPNDDLAVAAVIGVAGVYDMRLETLRRHGIGWTGKIEALLGASFDLDSTQEVARASSPILRIEDWAAKLDEAPPMLLLHGEHDRGVPILQSVEMAAALEQGGIPVDYVVVPDASHYVFHDQRPFVLDTIAEFLQGLESQTSPSLS